MKRRLVASTSFQKKLGNFIEKYPHLETKFSQVVGKLIQDPFYPTLKTHKLSGNLSQLFACRIDYQYRLVFHFDDQAIYLLNIGSHDEVY